MPSCNKYLKRENAQFRGHCVLFLGKCNIPFSPSPPIRSALILNFLIKAVGFEVSNDNYSVLLLAMWSSHLVLSGTILFKGEIQLLLLYARSSNCRHNFPLVSHYPCTWEVIVCLQYTLYPWHCIDDYFQVDVSMCQKVKEICFRNSQFTSFLTQLNGLFQLR